MKLSKDTTGLCNYVTENREYRVTHGYPDLNALKCWIVDSHNKDEKTRYFRTYKEAKTYVESK